MLEFKRTTNAFNFVFEKELNANETVIVKMPAVSPNKRGVNDVGWQSNGDVTLYGTLAENPEGIGTIWQEIGEGQEINKTITAIKVTNGTSACKVVIRAIFN